MGLFSFGADVKAEMMEKFRQVMAETGSVTVPELVRQVQAGDTSQWHEAASQAEGIRQGHEQTSDRGMRALQRMESSWTGDGADAAGGRIRDGVKVAQVSSETYGANARQFGDNAHALESLKAQLTPMPDQAPERSGWDTITPWDTDTEDQVNKYKAQVEANRQAYQSYEQTMQSAGSNVRQDFGDAGTLGGGFDISIDKNGGKDGDPSTGITTFTEPGTGSQTGSPGGSVSGPTGGQESVNVPSPQGGGPGGGTSSYTPNLPGPSTSDDSTSTSGYTSPSVDTPAASYQPPGYNSSTGYGSNSPGGGNSAGSFGGTLGGFGSTGGSTGTGSGAGGRFSAGGLGSGSGSGSGGAGARLTGGGAGGAGSLGAGKGTGVGGPMGPGGQAASSASGTSVGGAAARGGGMGAMGGAGAGRGQGSEDEEHQRRFVQDDDAAFALTEDGEVLRDPNTGNVITPPTIGG